MKKQNPDAPKTPRAPRVSKPVSAEAQALIAEATGKVNEAKSIVKEAKAISKIIHCVGSLGTWGIAKVRDAILARSRAISETEAAKSEAAS